MSCRFALGIVAPKCSGIVTDANKAQYPRTWRKRTPLEEIVQYEGGSLAPGSWSGNLPNREPPRGGPGGFPAIKVRVLHLCFGKKWNLTSQQLVKFRMSSRIVYCLGLGLYSNLTSHNRRLVKSTCQEKRRGGPPKNTSTSCPKNYKTLREGPGGRSKVTVMTIK